jgi:hypothetical protein
MGDHDTLLFDAIERYYLLMRSEEVDGQRAFQDLHRWFESRDATSPGAFERICARHELDPTLIRGMLRRRRASATGS